MPELNPTSVRSRHERFEDLQLRLERVVTLMCEPDFQALSDACEDMLEDFDKVRADTQQYFGLGNTSDPEDPAELAHFLFGRGYLGFFVEFAQPVIRKTGSTVQASFGRYRTRWFYAETFDLCAELALSWADSNWERAK